MESSLHQNAHKVAAQARGLPLRVGTRPSPLALVQTRHFLAMLSGFCPVLRDLNAFEEHAITTTGDAVQSVRLAEIGGKGLFAKEIHEALAEGRVDFAVHSLKDLETALPPGIVLACTLRREDARDALMLPDPAPRPDPLAPFDALPRGAVIGSSSVRRQSQMLHCRPDLRFMTLRGNVGTRIGKMEAGACDATILAMAGLRRLGMGERAAVAIDPSVMLPAACQGIVGVTVRESDVELHDLLAALEDPAARAVSLAERALLASLDGSCRTPIGGHAEILEGGLRLTGLVAREDGSFLIRRTLAGAPADAARIGAALGAELRAASPADVFA
jgi:hydroxymethylbilane synthase